jgi:chromosome segregation protein
VDDLTRVADDFNGIAVTTEGRAWFAATRELHQAPSGGQERVLAERNRRDSLIGKSEQAVQTEQDAIRAVESAGQAVSAADATREDADRAAREAARAHTAAAESARRAAWLIEQRRAAPQQGASAVRRAQVEGELAAERRVADRAAKDRADRAARIERLSGMVQRDRSLAPAAERLAAALELAHQAVTSRVEVLEAELSADREAGEGVATELRSCAAEEAKIQQRLREHGETVTAAEVRAQQIRDHESDASSELTTLAERLGLSAEPADEAIEEEQAEALRTRIERLQRRREQLGPVNPLAKAEYDEAIAYVEELERQRTDLETALRDLRAFIRDCDRQIRVTFEETFTAAAANFERLAGQLFPGGRGRLRLVREEAGPKPVLGGAAAPKDGTEEVRAEAEAEAAAEAEAQDSSGLDPDDVLGVEIEITPAGKSMKRLTLLSGGEKSMTAIAFLFAVFLARPCPFYILDEVEAALDDLNIGRFLELLRANADRAQFIVVTHQKRTMEAADTLYGVSMGDDGVSKVVSRRLPREVVSAAESDRAA